MVRTVAFYLPQFHPIPENDSWWGSGFTEWTNVTRARALFEGHYQPHLPADLGFYDLRVPEVRSAQAGLARQYGIDAFCYYHYWFGGRRLLERPVDDLLADSRVDMPFLLCWANENWTRVWNGGDSEVLIAQEYSPEDDRRHMRYLLDVFSDPRYLRVNGLPILLVYRPTRLPNPLATAQRWRDEAARREEALYLCAVEGLGTRIDPGELGFDAAVEFQPRRDVLGPRLRPTAPRRAAARLMRRPTAHNLHRIYSYGSLVERSLSQKPVPYKRFPCVCPGWDNSPRRRQQARILAGATPDLYERWLTGLLDGFRPFSDEEDLVFVNAWNEWAEGAHLEPDQQWGRLFLEAHARAVGASSDVASSECDAVGYRHQRTSAS